MITRREIQAKLDRTIERLNEIKKDTENLNANKRIQKRLWQTIGKLNKQINSLNEDSTALDTNTIVSNGTHYLSYLISIK